MSLHIEFDGIRDPETRKHLENSIRECMGDPSAAEEWITSVTSFGGYCTVVVKTLPQTRKKLFFLAAFRTIGGDSDMAKRISASLTQESLKFYYILGALEISVTCQQALQPPSASKRLEHRLYPSAEEKDREVDLDKRTFSLILFTSASVAARTCQRF